MIFKIINFFFSSFFFFNQFAHNAKFYRVWEIFRQEIVSARLNAYIKVLFWKKIELYYHDGIFVHV